MHGSRKSNHWIGYKLETRDIKRKAEAAMEWTEPLKIHQWIRRMEQ